jgi:hypothetical protein
MSLREGESESWIYEFSLELEGKLFICLKVLKVCTNSNTPSLIQERWTTAYLLSTTTYEYPRIVITTA